MQTGKITLQTSYARLEFNLKDIATLVMEGGRYNIERVVTLNGDSFSGFLLSNQIDVKLGSGISMQVRKEKVNQIGLRIRPEETSGFVRHHEVTLRNGDHFSCLVVNPTLTIKTDYGDAKIAVEQIAHIEFIGGTSEAVTKITLKNGDTMQGLIVDDDIAVKLDIGPSVKIYQGQFSTIVFGPKEAKTGDSAVSEPRE